MSDTSQAFERLHEIVKALRAPGGCPWDREQTPESMRANLIEEAYECVEAINEGDAAHVMEELGDVYMLATIIAQMYEESGDFSIADTLEGLNEKLRRRHPHVFGEAKASDSREVLRQWDDIKVNLEGKPPKDSVLDKVPKSLPPLERAYQLQRRASAKGFDWQAPEPVWAKLREELGELEESLAGADKAEREKELGDLFFSLINVSRFLELDPIIALQRANGKFEARFRYVEKEMREAGLAMEAAHFAEMDRLWEEAKAKGLG